MMDSSIICDSTFTPTFESSLSLDECVLLSLARVTTYLVAQGKSCYDYEMPTFQLKSIWIWMINFMKTLSLALVQTRLAEASRDIQEYTAGKWTNSVMNAALSASKCHCLLPIMSRVDCAVRISKSVNSKVLCTQ